jgi:hypothetical protein
MKRREATPEVLEKIKSLERIPFETFKELVSVGKIINTCNLKTARTIFYDQETCNFLYLNPYYADFQKCGYWSEDPNL